jgi:hypothetical protein
MKNLNPVFSLGFAALLALCSVAAAVGQQTTMESTARAANHAQAGASSKIENYLVLSL